MAEAEAVLAKSEVVVFGFGDQPAHAKAAAKLRETVLFAHTSAEEVLQILLLSLAPTLVLSSPTFLFLVCLGDDKAGSQGCYRAVPAKDPAEQV